MTLITTRTRVTGLLASAAAAALLLAGCASNPGADSSSDTPAAASDGFPLTIETAYGDIIVPEKAKRIVALTHNYVDLLVSLDEQPIGFSGTQSEEQFAAEYPWLEGKYTGGFDSDLLTAEYKPGIEAIAALEPDLILGDVWMIDEQTFDQLSQIAPTYAGIVPDQATPWEESLRVLGSATGKSAVAEQVIANTEDSYTTAAEELPGLQGRSFNGVLVAEEGFRYSSFGLLQDLGLEYGENQESFTTDNINEFISLENVEQLDADVLVVGSWILPDTEGVLNADPRFAELPASKNGAVIYFDNSRASAENGPLGIAWLLDGVVEELKKSSLANH